MERIYKYCHEDRIDILKNEMICFTPPRNFNDPFEFQPIIKPLYDLQSSHQLSGNQSLKDSEKQEMSPLKAKFLSAFMSESMSSIANSLGVLCLTEESDNILMWSHYANSHKGFVIDFDRNHDFFTKKTKYSLFPLELKRVIYLIERPEINLNDSEYDGSLKFFWLKSRHWDYEKEWRMIDSLQNCNEKKNKNNEDIYLFEIPLGCITGIIFGCRMMEENKEEFIKLLRGDKKYEHITLRQAEIDDREFRIVFKDI